MADIQEVDIKHVRPNPVSLRDVNTSGEAFLGLVDSIRNRGFMGAIPARERKDQDTGETYYEIIDGLHRYKACQQLGFKKIPVDLQKNYTDQDVLYAQVMANVHKVETTPAQYAAQLKRIMNSEPTLTVAQFASKLGKSPAWLEKVLSLNKIKNEHIRSAVDEGKMPVTNAYALAKLPEDERPSWLDTAITKKAKEFVPLVEDRVKEIRAAKRKGTNAKPREFQPSAKFRTLKEIKETLEDTGKIREAVKGIKDPVEAAVEAVRWCVQLDDASVAKAKRAWDEREKLKQEKKAKREAEKKKKAAEVARKKQEEAAKAAAEAEEALNG